MEHSIFWSADYSTVRANRYALMDARLRLALGPDGGHIFTFGPGFLLDGPFFLAASAGHRWAGPVNWGFDVVVTGYRIPWHSSTVWLHANPDDPNTILATDATNEDFERWQIGFGVSAVVELDLLPRPRR